MPEMDELSWYQQQQKIKTDLVLTAELHVTDVTTTVELQTESPIVVGDHVFGEAGHFTHVKVSVTRYTGDAVPDEDREPYYQASCYLHPKDGRRTPYWEPLPAEVARQLVGKALTA